MRWGPQCEIIGVVWAIDHSQMFVIVLGFHCCYTNFQVIDVYTYIYTFNDQANFCYNAPL